MGLVRMWLRRRLKLTAKEVTGNLDKNTCRVSCEQMLKEITVSQFALYHTANGQSTQITVPNRNMDDYIERIKDVTKIILKKNIPLPSVDISAEMRTVTVDRFLVSTDGFYLDVEKAVDRFKTAGLRLCLVMEHTDDAEYGVDEHNRRILSKLFNNMREVAQTLMEVSLTN